MKLRFTHENIYSIKENGLISTPVFGEGRMIPALVVDSDKDNGLEDILRMHKDSPPGDVVVYWSSPFSQFLRRKVWLLHIEFSQPMEFKFQIEFNLWQSYSLIDAIHIAGGFYLAHGKEGEKVSQKNEEMILVEVVDTDTDELWEKTLNGLLRKKLKKSGISKKRLKNEIVEHKKKMREILHLRGP